MTVSMTIEDGIGVVVIERPETRNAVDPETARALYRVCRDLDTDADVDVIVLTGAGGTFCSGFDLDAVGGEEASVWLDEVGIPDEWTDPISDPLPSPMGPCRLVLDTPTIAAIEGHAVAGGLELALWCDLRVASEEAVLGVFCRRWGVPLIDGGTVRLPRIVGQGRANDLILTGRPILADEAFGIGLVDRVTVPGNATRAAVDLARSIASFPPLCTRVDLAAARIPGEMLASGLRREWASTAVLSIEGADGAARFSAGAGRGGTFDDQPPDGRAPT